MLVNINKDQMIIKKPLQQATWTPLIGYKVYIHAPRVATICFTFLVKYCFNKLTIISKFKKSLC
jgi:hypothetical protein